LLQEIPLPKPNINRQKNMTTQTETPSLYWEQELREEKPVDFYPTPSDPSHIVVSQFLPIEGKEVIAHVHVVYDKDEIWYVGTNRKGREIFAPTSDFSLLEMKFQRYAHLLALQQRIKSQRKLIIKNFNIKNINTMKTQQQSLKKENQFRFIEYERAKGDGHFLTIADSYHNVIGRVHKTFNDETKKYEYVAFDHAGNIFSKSDRLWDVKKEFINNREQLLEQAHERRIESKQQSKTVAAEKPQAKQLVKAQKRKNEIENLRGEKSGKGKQVEMPSDKARERTDSHRNEVGSNGNADNENNEQEREDELSDLRDSQDDDRGDTDMDR
jgi:hypothetical protein